MDGESYGYGGRYYFSNSSTYETYIVDINGHYTKLSTTTYTSVCHTTTDGYVAFNADSTAYLYDVTDTTVHTLGSLGGSQHGFKLFDFDDKLYWAVPTQTRSGSSYTYGMRLYLYNKSTKTVSTTSYSGQDISFNGGKPYVAYKTSFIQDGILFDYSDGNYVRLTTTSPQAGKLTLYTDSSKQYTLGRCEGDTVYVYPTGVIVPINKSKISGTVSFTDVQLSSGKYAIVNCTLTPIEVTLDKQDTSAIVIDRYKVSTNEYENVRYTFSSLKNQEGSVRYPDCWHTTNTYESNGYGQCCRFRWYHFKESDNPEYTLIVTGFTENSNIKPSTALLIEVGKTQISIPYTDVASAIGLTAEKIKAGVTILGVEGTYDGPGYDTNLVLDNLDAGGAEQYLGGTPITDITNVSGFDVFNTNGDSILYYVMKTVTARSNMTGFSMNNIRVLDDGVIQWIPYGNNTVFNTDDFLECTITCTDAYNNTETKIITIYNSEKENDPGPDGPGPGPDDPGELE